MLLVFPLLFYIFYKLLAGRSAALIEARIDSIFVRVHELAYLHAEQETLTVAFRNAEAAQQLRCNLSTVVISVDDSSGSYSVCAVVFSESLLPERFVFSAVAVP